MYSSNVSGAMGRSGKDSNLCTHESTTRGVTDVTRHVIVGMPERRTLVLDVTRRTDTSTDTTNPNTSRVTLQVCCHGNGLVRERSCVGPVMCYVLITKTCLRQLHSDPESTYLIKAISGLLRGPVAQGPGGPGYSSPWMEQ